ncbi:hypothetical protein BGZ63DRAFT_376586 [Mariannaea sp. PMI_226]|nr:hypothetical protein BGZ63DRAFT_376586 [Mariannaea sp. PMI_226]
MNDHYFLRSWYSREYSGPITRAANYEREFEEEKKKSLQMARDLQPNLLFVDPECYSMI